MCLKLLVTVDIVNPDLRRQLQFGDPALSGLVGNNLPKYSRALDGNNCSHISIGHINGVLVAMHVKPVAAYSISYLHNISKTELVCKQSWH